VTPWPFKVLSSEKKEKTDIDGMRI
jgi:hypothetical protein